MHELLLKNIAERITLSPTDSVELKKFFIPKKLRKRQYLLNAGDVCQNFTFVEKVCFGLSL